MFSALLFVDLRLGRPRRERHLWVKVCGASDVHQHPGTLCGDKVEQLLHQVREPLHHGAADEKQGAAGRGGGGKQGDLYVVRGNNRLLENARHV